eukprot:scaffold2510_cov169-Amphora_coffeaeformis.AAC.65
MARGYSDVHLVPCIRWMGRNIKKCDHCGSQIYAASVRSNPILFGSGLRKRDRCERSSHGLTLFFFHNNKK